jgi:hypothetical protein
MNVAEFELIGGFNSGLYSFTGVLGLTINASGDVTAVTPV